MSERDAFVRAICESPEDDLPRLVFADWLDEHDEHDRAEFIRVQCKIARLRPMDMMCERTDEVLSHAGGARLFTPRCRCKPCSLARREYMVSRRYTVWDWCKPIPPGTRNTYTRGFVSRIQLSCADFLANAEFIFRAHPITSVHLTDRVLYDNNAYVRDEADAIRYALRVWQANHGNSEAMPPVASHENGRDELEALGVRTFQDRGFVCSIECTASSFLTRAAAIFAAQPVTEVVLTDVRSGFHRFWDGGAIFEPPFEENAPTVIFERLWEAYPELQGSGEAARILNGEAARILNGFKSDAVANNALSAACVAHGRELAGLVKLEVAA